MVIVPASPIWTGLVHAVASRQSDKTKRHRSDDRVQDPLGPIYISVWTPLLVHGTAVIYAGALKYIYAVNVNYRGVGGSVIDGVSPHLKGSLIDAKREVVP